MHYMDKYFLSARIHLQMSYYLWGWNGLKDHIVCTDNLNADVMVVKSAQDGA
jgi:hypothetical protein